MFRQKDWRTRQRFVAGAHIYSWLPACRQADITYGLTYSISKEITTLKESWG
jgi:hypothetical protein